MLELKTRKMSDINYPRKLPRNRHLRRHMCGEKKLLVSRCREHFPLTQLEATAPPEHVERASSVEQRVYAYTHKRLSKCALIIDYKCRNKLASPSIDICRVNALPRFFSPYFFNTLFSDVYREKVVMTLRFRGRHHYTSRGYIIFFGSPFVRLVFRAPEHHRSHTRTNFP